MKGVVGREEEMGRRDDDGRWRMELDEEKMSPAPIGANDELSQRLFTPPPLSPIPPSPSFASSPNSSHHHHFQSSTLVACTLSLCIFLFSPHRLHSMASHAAKRKSRDDDAYLDDEARTPTNSPPRKKMRITRNQKQALIDNLQLESMVSFSEAAD